MVTAIPAKAAEAERFALHLRDETIVEHRQTERSPFVLQLLKGQLPLGGFAQMTAQWHFLYGVLESEVRRQGAHPIVCAFADRRLERADALASDLDVLIGADWRASIAPLSPTVEYTGRLRELGTKWPIGLVAHHYLRYMGDLSGGQIIARVAGRTYGLDENAGLSFYSFDQIADGARYKADYRDRLDAAALTQTERQALVDEVNRGYRLTAKIFAELEQSGAAAAASSADP